MKKRPSQNLVKSLKWRKNTASTTAKPNRFASRMKDQPPVAVIDPDVAKIFTTAEQVNNALRALISSMPTAK